MIYTNNCARVALPAERDAGLDRDAHLDRRRQDGVLIVVVLFVDPSDPPRMKRCLTRGGL